jgi:hypothetical protein
MSAVRSRERMPDAAVEPAGDDLEAVQRYLRRRDKVGGYLPILAMPAHAAPLWTRLWRDVRELDDRSERTPVRGDGDPVLGRELLATRPDLADDLRDLARWPRVEHELYRDRRVHGIEQYFRLMYYRAFLPVHLCGTVGLAGEPPEALRTFALYVGYGAQLMDDTLDLVADIEDGRVFVTREELALLGLAASELRSSSALARVTRFRNHWALYFYLRAHRATGLFAAPARRLARSWLEFGLRALLDGRIVPLPRDVLESHRRYCEHFGAYMSLLDLPFPTERMRYSFLRWFVGRFVATSTILDIDAAHEAYARDPAPLPDEFRIERLCNERWRDWRPLEPPEPIPEDRRPVALVHYGLRGMPATLADLSRIALRR